MIANNHSAVSVIIPVYKVEKYLLRCVNSVLAQTFTDYEIILVDDGSPDNCPTICDELSQKNTFVKVIHKTNGGLASARNAGLDIATGKYIFFLDSDDWIEPDTLKDQYLLAEKEDVDFIRTRPMYANWPNHKDGEVCCFGTEQRLREGKYNRKRIEEEILPYSIATKQLAMGVIISAWGGLYRTEFIRNNKLRFYEDIRYSEDLIFNVHVILNANSFFFCESKNYYNYYFNNSSITKVYHPDIWENNKIVLNHFRIDFSNCEEYDFSEQLRYNSIFYILDAIGERRGLKQFTARKKHCKQICNDSVTIDAMKDLRGLDVSWKLKLVLLMIKFRLSSLLAMIR